MKLSFPFLSLPLSLPSALLSHPFLPSLLLQFTVPSHYLPSLLFSLIFFPITVNIQSYFHFRRMLWRSDVYMPRTVVPTSVLPLGRRWLVCGAERAPPALTPRLYRPPAFISSPLHSHERASLSGPGITVGISLKPKLPEGLGPAGQRRGFW